jgi:Reverse transcriptase (RNA-dependent DNA polymerase)
MPEVIPIIPGSKIPNRPMFRYSPQESAAIEAEVKKLLEQKIIQPSTSPYGASVLLVKKPDGSWRFCVDYRALNAVTVKNSYPLPRIDDLLDKIQGAKFFSSMDLLLGFYQLQLRDSDKPKTAFKTTMGLYEFRCVAMGISNGPSVMQSMMSHIFRHALNKHILIYLDDLLIFSRTEEEHLRHIRDVLETLRRNGLTAKLKKCHFLKKELHFLGHIISREGIKPDDSKVEAIKNWPRPTTQSEVRSFCGLMNYFKKSIKGYAQIAAPLTDLTADKYKGQAILWTDHLETTFNRLKEALITAPVLAIPDFSKPFRMVTGWLGWCAPPGGQAMCI